MEMRTKGKIFFIIVNLCFILWELSYKKEGKTVKFFFSAVTNVSFLLLGKFKKKFSQA